MPPVPDTKTCSWNSHASTCAPQIRSPDIDIGGAGPARPRRRMSWQADDRSSLILPDTSIAKNTTAWVVGVARRTSCRKRKSSSEKGGADSPCAWRRFTASFMERRRSSRDRAPRRFNLRVCTPRRSSTDTRCRFGLELFPQPVDDVVDGQFQHKLHATWLRDALALVLAAGVVLGNS